jgi:hypothetical protein
MAREIIRTNGLGTNGIYLGLGATLWRHGFYLKNFFINN